MIRLKTSHVLRGLVRRRWYAVIIVPFVVGAAVLAAEIPSATARHRRPLSGGRHLQPHEPFKPGGPIGSQTPDGYNALGPVVTQPIEFPHYIHVEKMGIDCMYCHTYARRSAVSGIPRLSKCIGCHQNIESVKDKPRIKMLLDYWDEAAGHSLEESARSAGFRALQS